MDKFRWHAAWGLCLLQLSLAQIDLNITCRFAGVFHVEKNGRYSISRTEAADLCKAFNSTLPTMAQMEKALSVGFETCRYGFIEGHVVIPRIQPNSICAANHTGVYILTSNTSQYDTYCFNASAPPKEDCTSVTDLPNAFDGPITITIVNPDGTRYIKKGEYRTNPEDIYPSNPTDDDVSSGSSSERSSTSGGYIFHTFSTAHPIPDEDGPWITDSTDRIPATISTTPRVFDHTKQNKDWTQWNPSHSNPEVLLQTTARITDVDRNGTTAHEGNWNPEAHPPLIHHEHHEEEETPHSTSTIQAIPSSTTEETATQKEQWFGNRWHEGYLQTPREDSHSTTGTAAASALTSHPMQGRTTPSPEDSSWTDFFDPISHPMGRGHQAGRRMDMDSSHSTTLQPTADPNTGLVEDLDRTGPLSMTTKQSNSQSFSTSHEGLEEDKDHPTTSTLTSSNRNDVTGGRRDPNHSEGSTTLLEGYTSHYPDTKESRTFIPVTSAKTGSFGVTEVTVGDSNSNVNHSLSGDQDAFYPSGGSHTTHGSESAGHSHGSQEGGANTTSGPVRTPQIPEWLIILASLLALALILAVCIAVNSRRRCGQKKKLVINSGNGAVDDRKPSGLNGEASKSQEMVHLVNKEPSETPDQFMTADETRNLQNVDMKIGV
ncbi:CD44 antigen isoform X10 [Macaca thibetana thibetana]|uniref:CD44 antigen isoform X10 n=1 Tax=Macaca mulatta TaxID=9544 RepID=UPI00073277A8|nr:CD44 antigen isoform X10 [Macaca mulatta]XP_045226351.1 CD44 antigen isoform X11 [Macaca fascicularis]XP_050614700.1 CD44 antigen isoform X10 [Macaca thibetana thibetana]